MNPQKISVLQVGVSDWSKKFSLPDQLKWNFITVEKAQKKLLLKDGFKPRVLMLTDLEQLDDLNETIRKTAPVYAVLYPQEQKSISPKIVDFLKNKRAVAVSLKDPTKLLKKIALSFFDNQSGIKLGVNNIEINPAFNGTQTYHGNSSLELDSNYGSEYRPLVYWRNSMYVDPGKRVEVWLEYLKEESVNLKLQFFETANGSTENEQPTWTLSEQQLQQPEILERTHNEKNGSYLNAVLWIKGQGKIEISSLHFRWSRYEFGNLIVGGQRMVDRFRQEFFYYFDPGDLKPPLNVYFAGYRSLEGFEGYGMLKKLGAPFLLFTDPRLEGGNFYIGSQEYEQKLLGVIKKVVAELGFTQQQIILSGISMGTFAALYYGSFLKAHAIILGKPLINLGLIAENNRLLRPQEFDTSLDILMSGKAKGSSSKDLNHYIWRKLLQGNFKETVIAAAYMKNDDYDGLAFKQLVHQLQPQQVKILGKGWIGRHNDNTPAIISWFLNQYNYFLRNDFERNNYE